ncbi:Uncharacterised protein [uncultured archaeon]|nr:Uncharacterised protein [uncultured archaeon]
MKLFIFEKASKSGLKEFIVLLKVELTEGVGEGLGDGITVTEGVAVALVEFVKFNWTVKFVLELLVKLLVTFKV